MSNAPTTIRVTRHYTAFPERVFDAWVDPAKATKWLFATPTGQMIRAEIEPRVGGSFVFVDRRPEGDAHHQGTYLEIERPHRLVFDFFVQQDPSNTTRVQVDIRAAFGGSELTLTHEKVPAEVADRSQAGWKKVLDALEEHALAQG